MSMDGCDPAPGAWGVDENGDGRAEFTEYDQDGNGVVEMIAHDSDGDGYAETLYLDRDQDGVLEEVQRDTNLDGRVDVQSVDDDRDGVLDRVFVDTDGDGVLELQDNLPAGPAGPIPVAPGQAPVDVPADTSMLPSEMQGQSPASLVEWLNDPAVQENSELKELIERVLNFNTKSASYFLGGKGD